MDQNPPHQLCRDSEEVGAILPPNVLPANEPNIGFIDESCGLQ
jgi:hypothetical protein